MTVLREAFRSKGRFRNYMDEIPVWVVTNDDAGLIGAAAAALHRDGR